MNNKRAIYKFLIFEFLIFCFSKLVKSANFDPPKKTFLSLRFLLNYNNIQNMDEITLTEEGWARKVQNLIFCH